MPSISILAFITGKENFNNLYISPVSPVEAIKNECRTKYDPESLVQVLQAVAENKIKAYTKIEKNH